MESMNNEPDPSDHERLTEALQRHELQERVNNLSEMLQVVTKEQQEELDKEARFRWELMEATKEWLTGATSPFAPSSDSQSEQPRRIIATRLNPAVPAVIAREARETASGFQSSLAFASSLRKIMPPSLLESTTTGLPIRAGLKTRSQEQKKLLQSTRAMRVMAVLEISAQAFR
jgi:hypothetical protein